MENVTSKQLELAKILSNEYMDKHHHYWNIYFKFLFSLIAILGLIIVGERPLVYFFQCNKALTTIICSLIVFSIGLCSSCIMIQEGVALNSIRQNYEQVFNCLGMSTYTIPEETSRLERKLRSLMPIKRTMTISLISVTILEIVLIVIIAYYYIPAK